MNYNTLRHLFVLCVLCMSPIFGQSIAPTDNTSFTVEETTQSLILKNEFIKVIVNNKSADQGRFAIETINGNPSTTADDNQPLIYGRPLPWTSYTTLLIDNEPYIFGTKSKKTETRAKKTFKYTGLTKQTTTQRGILSEGVTQNVYISQNLSFFRNPSTKVNDSALIEYYIVNQSETTKNIGLRILLDTQLGTNDGAPFRLGEREIISESAIDALSLQDYWQTFDNLISPNVIAQGSLNLPEFDIYPPQKVIIANWGTLVDNPWNIEVKEGRSFIREGEVEKDTALTLFWDPIVLGPGKSITRKTIYGLGGLSLSPGDISLGLTAPAEQLQSSKKEFLILAYVQNSGGFESKETTLTLKLPKEFIINEGAMRTNLGPMYPGQTKQVPFKIKLASPPIGNQLIEAIVTSSTLEDNRITRNIDILTPPNLSSSLKVSPSKAFDSPYFDVLLTLTNNSRFKISDIEAQLSYPNTITLPKFELTKKSLLSLNPLQTKTIHWRLKQTAPLASTDTITASFQSSITSKQTQKDTVKPWASTPPLRIKSSRSTIKQDDYFFVSLSKIDFLSDPKHVQVQYDPYKLRYIRTSLHPSYKDTLKVNQVDGNIELRPSGNTLDIHTPIQFHFKALQLGETSVTLTADQVKGLPIKLTIDPITHLSTETEKKQTKEN